MKPIRLLYILIAVGAPAGAALAQEIYQNRPPIAVYRSLIIPPENPPPAQTPPPPPARSETPATPTCSGFGCPPTELEVAQRLLASGPDTQPADMFLATQKPKFAVIGFVQDGWPISVEYIAEPNTVTLLQIRLYHHRKFLIFELPFYEVAFEQNLDALPAEIETDNPWHRTVKLDPIKLMRSADPAADGGLHVARIDVRSYRLDGNAIRTERGRSVRAPVDVIGIAVGHGAVGSLTLRMTELSSDSVSVPQEGEAPATLNYRYSVDTRYDLIRDMLQQYSDQALDYRTRRDLGSPHSGGIGQTFRGTWTITHRQQPGRYRVSVTGWEDCGGGTLSARLQGCAKNPDWSVGRSSDIYLR